MLLTLYVTDRTGYLLQKSGFDTLIKAYDSQVYQTYSISLKKRNQPDFSLPDEGRSAKQDIAQLPASGSYSITQ